VPRANSFATPTASSTSHYQVDILPHNKYIGRIKQPNSYTRRKQTFQLYDTTIIPAAKSVIEQAAAASQGVVLADYQSDAAALFNNMKLPAAVVTAGMISLGFATRFPELPKDTMDKVYPTNVRQRVAKLDRLHIVLSLISITSELLVVLWAAVEVNQLTEREFLPAYGVWDLIHRDCDLAWSAVNTYYILGIIGFTIMLWLRAYVMLIIANASKNLMRAASTGTGAALCLMVSIVNRGVESGGGNSIDRYGESILDLMTHYVSLLMAAAMNMESPGPLQLTAIVLEILSLTFFVAVLMTETEASYEEQTDEDSCSIDLYEKMNDEEQAANISSKEREIYNKCVDLAEEEEETRRKERELEDEEEKRRREEGDSSSSGKSALVLFCHMNLCVQYEVSVAWPLHLNFICHYLIAFAPRVLTGGMIISLHLHNYETFIFQVVVWSNEVHINLLLARYCLNTDRT